MAIERWGAFSVVDHRDARKMAGEVLLYNRLVLPTPTEWDRPRWVSNNWDPDGLERRLKQLGDLAIPATWDCQRQKEWAKKFHALREDAQDMNAAMHQTRRVLAEHGRDYRPPGVAAVEVLAAYQSEGAFAELDPASPDRSSASELDFLVAHRLAVPDEEDPEESLRRALHLCTDDTFCERRRRFHDWQRQILLNGVVPVDAARELEQLVRECNKVVERAAKSVRGETAMLVGGLSAATLATIAGIVPAAFVAVGIGVLKGTQVISIGNAAIGGILQIVRHVRGRRDPDSGARDLSGAMFHQIEAELGWRLRSDPTEHRPTPR